MRQMTVERHYTRLLRAPRHWERVRCPPVMEAEAVAAMTCPGAIPLKTAVFACARASQYGVTI
ncbi:hypothetical protein [Flavonifractor phage Castelnaud]|nr:hypothetical protein [Flavonifractor phage Castelnaud]